MNAPISPPVLVGTCTIDLERQVLLDAQGSPLPLRPQAWRVLCALAASAGRVVSKDTLIESVWGNAAVTDDALVQAVVDIRRALGQGSRDRLRTVPRRGYLLLADAGSASDCPTRADAVGVPSTCHALDAQARRVFVGRRAELGRLLDLALGSPSSPRVGLVHGVGGIGKSMLLERLACEAADHGLRVISLDAQLVEPLPCALLAALARALGIPTAPSSPAELANHWPVEPSLLLIDTAECIETLQPFLREQLLPALPDAMRAVIAGRERPQPRWFGHPRWGLAVESIELSELSGEDSLALLERLGVDAGLRNRASELARGHALALTLIAEQAGRIGRPADALDADILELLMQRCLSQAPDAAHRRTLQVASLVDRVSESLLAETICPERAPVLLDWLERQACVKRHPDGLAVHDLIREAVTADHRRRDPDAARGLLQSVFAFLTRRLRSAPLDGPVTSGVARLLRSMPEFRRLFVEGMNRYVVDTPGEDDRDAVRGLLARGLPPAEQRVCAHWSDHPAARWRVIREDGERVCGVICTLRLDKLGDTDRGVDPLVDRVLEALGAPLPVKTVMARFSVPEGERGQRNPVMNALQCHQARSWAIEPDLGLWVVVSVHPERYADLFRYMRFATLRGCEVIADGVPVGCFVHDWRVEPWEQWFEEVMRAAAIAARERPRSLAS